MVPAGSGNFETTVSVSRSHNLIPSNFPFPTAVCTCVRRSSPEPLSPTTLKGSAIGFLSSLFQTISVVSMVLAGPPISGVPNPATRDSTISLYHPICAFRPLDLFSLDHTRVYEPFPVKRRLFCLRHIFKYHRGSILRRKIVYPKPPSEFYSTRHIPGLSTNGIMQQCWSTYMSTPRSCVPVLATSGTVRLTLF